MRLQNKVAIITGAGQGIGRAYALRFAQEGARVVVADLNEATAGQVMTEIEAAGATAFAIKADVADPKSVQSMVSQTVEKFGRVDILVNNAAIFATLTMKPFEEIGLEEWNRLLAVNLTGTFLCCQAVAPYMRAQKAGRIVNISSSTVLLGRPYYAHYVTSKAGVIGLTRVLAKELGAYNITANVVLPGSTETEIPRATVSAEQAKVLIEAQALHRRGTPADIVGTVVFLASDEASFITGQSIVVDGGLNFL